MLAYGLSAATGMTLSVLEGHSLIASFYTYLWRVAWSSASAELLHA